MWFCIVISEAVFLVWFWSKPPWVTIEKTTVDHWRKDIKAYPSRHLQYSFNFPFIIITKVDKDAYEEKRKRLAEHLYPTVGICPA